MNVLLETREVKKYFKTPKGLLHAVDGVSFTLESGKTLGVVGESGCGKSTLGRVILNLLEATGGEVIYKGRNIVGKKGEELMALRREMQIIFQDPYSSLDPRMTVSEIIGEPLIIYKECKNKEEYHRTVSELMRTVGLAQRLTNTYPHELDGGRRQRIGVARALALNPKFIVCDEPVSALDVSIQAQILNLMMDLQEEKGLTYLFITHDLSVVKHISDDILVMYLGQMVKKASKHELFANSLHPYTRALLAAIPIPSSNARELRSKRTLLRGEIYSPINPKHGCRFVGRCQHVTTDCKTKNPELLEVLQGHFVACHNLDVIHGEILRRS